MVHEVTLDDQFDRADIRVDFIVPFIDESESDMAQQARAPEAKQQRKEKIAEAALRLFAQKPYKGITVAQVAAEAGLAKGTVYLYFKTKEEVFLFAVERDEQAWTNELSDRFAKIDPHNGRSAVAGAIGREVADAIESRLSFIRLLTRLRTTIAEQADAQTIVEMKRRTRARIEFPVQQLSGLLPGLGEQGSLQLLVRIHLMVIGYVSVVEAREDVRTAISNSPDLAAFHDGIESGLREAVTALVLGTILEAN